MEKSLNVISKEYWGKYISPRSELIWHEKPKVNFSLSFFERKQRSDTSEYSTFRTVAAYFCLTFFVLFWACNGSPFFAFIFGFLAVFLPFAIDLLFYFKNLKTEYAITNDAILFKFFNGIKYKVYEIPMKDIIAVNLVGDDDERGTLHIITACRVDFNTYNIHNQGRRDHPTIEFVENANLAHEIIKSRTKNNPPRKLIYKPPVLTSSTLKLYRSIIFGFIVFFLHLGYKNYLIPIFKEGPVHFDYGFHQYLFLICIASLGLSLLWMYKKEGENEEKIYPIVFVNLILMFCYWLTYLAQV